MESRPVPSFAFCLFPSRGPLSFSFIYCWAKRKLYIMVFGELGLSESGCCRNFSSYAAFAFLCSGIPASLLIQL